MTVSRLGGDTLQGLSMQWIPVSEGLIDADSMKVKIPGAEAYRTRP